MWKQVPGLALSLGPCPSTISLPVSWVSLYVCVLHLYNVFTPTIPFEPQNHHRKEAEWGSLSPLYRQKNRGSERGNDLPSSLGDQG